MKVSYNITQNKFNASLNQDTTEIKVSFKTGYYPFPSDLDISNLVPYTGANKDVNIASNYFKTSKGFDFAFDENNYFRSFHDGLYNQFKFYSKDNSEDNFGIAVFTINPEEGFIIEKVNGNGIRNTFYVLETGTYTTKPFISDGGFIKTGGTANQALRADGGTFDLNTKADIDDIPTKTSFTHDILVSNWALVSGKYEAVISNAGILANSFVDVIPSNDNVDIVRNAQIYPSVLISAGSVKVYSKFLPSGTISVTVNII